MNTKIKTLAKRFWYRCFPKYRTVEGRAATYEAADKMIRDTANLDDPNRWDIWPEQEDYNRQIGVVFIRRRERILMVLLMIFALSSCDRSMNDSWLSPPSCHKKECMEADGYNIVGSPSQ